MLRLLNSDVRIINCDETWLNELGRYNETFTATLSLKLHAIVLINVFVACVDFRRRKWRLRGESNSIPLKPVEPRISVILAIDNYGEAFVTMTQVNTDENVFCLYLENLSAKLTKDSPNWKQNSILLLDSAKYHCSQQTRDVLARIGCRVCFTAPYSYETSPIELAFAAVKRTFINPSY